MIIAMTTGISWYSCMGCSSWLSAGLAINLSRLHLVEYTACLPDLLRPLPFISWLASSWQSWAPHLHQLLPRLSPASLPC